MGYISGIVYGLEILMYFGVLITQNWNAEDVIVCAYCSKLFLMHKYDYKCI